MCGEKNGRPVAGSRAMGSPPRVRGKAGFHVELSADLWITPACAGKRNLLVSQSVNPWDHPRVCGEKSVRAKSLVPSTGSPPRVRGKAPSRRRIGAAVRITPACAGKRKQKNKSSLSSGDHPRVCGEKAGEGTAAPLPPGSPPRVRGKVTASSRGALLLGITPACAGKRLKRSHSIGHFSCILCLFHSVLHRASVSGGSRAGPCAPPCLPAQNAVPV